ncbi:hypothetical protein HanRHA438_Chr07g0327021 [Helianthus annuus]|nr:hypothetical protein HanHA300_Chr07g0261511 [Helianthus annuus]KAJ0564800.1 hypothetical protein HanHA89_Chr07g0278231 [Helianthus annuus]KAJ0909948.1 hypothetical protein HanRHA438_Chr07g0327021 [Helianthus annuus]
MTLPWIMFGIVMRTHGSTHVLWAAPDGYLTHLIICKNGFWVERLGASSRQFLAVNLKQLILFVIQRNIYIFFHITTVKWSRV